MIRQDFSYELPKRLIAQTPIPKREESRLMVIDKKTGAYEHKVFKDILCYIDKGDCLVINNTKVIPARLIGNNGSSSVEFLLLNKTSAKDQWEVLVKPGKKAKPGHRIIFGGGLLIGDVISIGEGGKRTVQFEYGNTCVFEEILDMLGEMPLPPYITQKLVDKSRYQTVYAKCDGSAAAPTAGLHFTEELLSGLRDKGVIIANVTLHVGLGTFRPVKVDDISEHEMHSEYCNIEVQEACKINEAKNSGGRIIAVGTTSCRTLESRAYGGRVEPGNGYTDIFIYPGYEFKIVDSLITNFHLPESTLIMLVSALCGRKAVLEAYREAVRQEYRFFSFGDAMFIKTGKPESSDEGGIVTINPSMFPQH